eukprot:2041777-Amphidinium_carterae.1
MFRVVTGPQADLGRWMHVLLQVRPEECLHLINLYGWVDDEHSTRQLIIEVAACAAELSGSRLLVGGDWNLEPDEFPIDLVQGSGLHRPLARPGASAPQGTRRLDWFLASTNLLPSVGWEAVTGFKPDHSAVAIEVLLDFKVAQYQGIQKAPVANLEGAPERFHIDSTLWAAAVDEQDVEKLWELWNSAATRALEVRPQGRGQLTLESKTLRPPKGHRDKGDRETQHEAFRQHYEAGLLRMARTGQA